MPVLLVGPRMRLATRPGFWKQAHAVGTMRVELQLAYTDNDLTSDRSTRPSTAHAAPLAALRCATALPDVRLTDRRRTRRCGRMLAQATEFRDVHAILLLLWGRRRTTS